MSSPARFDHAAAKRRWAAGETKASIARSLGVSDAAVARVVDPVVGARIDARSRAWQRGGVCRECGAACSRTSRDRGQRCRSCGTAAQVTTVREGELKCAHCGEWKPDSEFPGNRSERHRRGRHTACRECGTKVKRRWRERNRERDNATARARRARKREAAT